VAFIPRPHYEKQVRAALRRSPVVTLLGPRQSGKTTLARGLASEYDATYLDMEDRRDLAKLASPALALEPMTGLVIIDEAQRKPELFETLRVLVDRPDNKTRFLLLGSASPRLVKGVSETLAGRIAFVDLSGFDLSEVGAGSLQRLWVRGGFPPAFLAPDETSSLDWRQDFLRTLLERDIAQLGITVPAETLRRFWTMVAHYHAQTWNAAEFARSLGSAEATARRYLDILSGAYMVRQLQPWFQNIGKRQVKSPKVYVRDSGLLHALLEIETFDQLAGHPKLGASWEGFVIEQTLALCGSRNVYFWATHAGCELDLFMLRAGKRLGFEVKYTDAPSTTKSMRIAMSDLGLDSLYVNHPGPETFPLDDRITALAARDLPTLFK